jgi:hypothetical protein
MPADAADKNAQTPQFSLLSLFVLTSLVAVQLALFHWFGTLGFVFGFLALVVAIGIWNHQHAGTVVLAVAVVGIFVALLAPVVLYSPREPSRRMLCYNNIKQLVLAFHNYHDEHSCFPPAYITDENGRPMHSWRVLIYPYIEGSTALAGYDFNEPWDGPNNRKLASQMPDIFRCPAHSKGASGETHYVAVVGDETIWRQSKSMSFTEMLDGSTNTIALVEAVDSGINWLEPRDLDFSTMSFTINATGGASLSSDHPGGCMVALADGSARFLGETMPPETLRALLTASGDEPIGDY